MSTVVSAPGKVLIIGGYLILDRLYEGLAIGVDARFYTVINSGNNTPSKIIVRSPQFNDGNWEYQVSRVQDIYKVKAIDKDKKNKFIEITIKYCLSIIASRISQSKFDEKIRDGLIIYIVGNNDFYSQREQLKIHKLPLNASSLRLLPSFNKMSVTLKQVHKTGLGSSASLITSMNELNGGELNKVVDPTFNKWDNQVVSISLPPQFNLILADINIGSNTPSLVNKVLNWRKSNPNEAKTLWDKLASHNSKIINNIHELNKEYKSNKLEYEKVIAICSNKKFSDKIRQFLREMSTLSNTQIEPPEQTRLLDACMEIPGVILAGVPGAGGFDAIFCIGIGNNFIEKVEDLWSTWSEMSVGPLLANESSEGFKLEKLENIKGLAEMIQS
ncbi:11890_t:CDS:2 [Diversispora eburnea]|uniref:phosphomevalonate kinase n=1 Tax=Diversispora eburnea TaxID=1213867 RepID=A0A9N9G9I3_9GLOM|nr:11890_t:CDS:2 [Diversispora eburnea]